MRLWEDLPVGTNHPGNRARLRNRRYVIKGRAELHLENQTLILEAGDSWIVPRGAQHGYRILEPFTAVEATHPPAVIHGRDKESR